MTKISLCRCLNYEPAEIAAAVEKAVNLVGGIESVVKPGMKVLLKPNLLSARVPEEAVCTHPEVVRVVARLVKAAGGIPKIGDSPGGYGTNIAEVFTKSGMRAMAHEEGVELVKFTTSKFVDGIPISRHVLHCDCLISIPKLKTHGITVITAAVKNMYGTVTGLYKAECHSKAPHEEDFARIIAKVYSISKPHLTVLDGVVGMEGDGPAAGNPKKMEIIMASRDAVAIDSCIAKIVGLEPLDITVTRVAHEMGLGEADLARMEILGDDINSFARPDFKLPQTTLLKHIPKSLVKSISSLIRFKPFIDSSICLRCNLCKISCPVFAIEIGKETCSIDYKKCVRCLCCQEVCPYKAISIKRNILTKMVWG